MKTNRTLPVPALLVGASLFLTAMVRAADAPPTTGTMPPSASLDLAQAKVAYPLDTCVVSGEPLEGDMGGPIDYMHKEAGQPDRLVRFCCKDCIEDFKKDPAQHLKKIDDAAMAKMGSTVPMK